MNDFTLGLFAWCRHVNVAKFVTSPRTAVLRSRGGVTHSGETRLPQTPLQGLGFQHVNSFTCGEIAGLAPGRPFYLLQDKCAVLFHTVPFGLRQGNNLNLTRDVSLSGGACM